MPLFARKPRAVPPPSGALQPGETVERSVLAALLYGKQSIDGALHLTDRRLLFEAKKGDARWMVVPFEEIRSADLFPAPGASMGRTSSRRQCLFVQTTKGEHVWWDFGEKDEREWLPLVQAKIPAPAADET